MSAGINHTGINWLLYWKNAEKSYYAELLESNKSNLKKTWSILKNIVNKKRVNKMQEKFKITDNTITTDKSAIVENFNDFFVNIGHDLAKRIPDVGIFPKKYLGDWVLQTIFLEPVTPEELSKIVQSLKNGAPGHDGVSSQILKETMNAIIDPLCFCVIDPWNKVSSPMNWNLQMYYPCSNREIPCFSIIIARYHYCVLCQRFSRGSCFPDCWIFLKNTTFSLKTNLGSGVCILLIWLWCLWWIK